MSLLTTLKKMREIQPDPHYQARSRSIVLRTAFPQPPIRAVWKWFIINIESAASLALAGTLLFLVFSGFSIWKSLSPLGIARPDLNALRAEAEAIDIQIQLANLSYQESTVSLLAPASSPKILELEKESATNASNNSLSTTSSRFTDTLSTSTLSIDSALEKLAQ